MNRYNNLQPFEDTGRLRRLRWWLNLVFIIGAIVINYFIALVFQIEYRASSYHFPIRVT